MLQRPLLISLLTICFVQKCFGQLENQGQGQCGCCQGPPGAPGIQGPQGVNGIPGPAGTPGVPGQHGLPGAKGEKGESGDVTKMTMATGPAGPKGQKGEKGLEGVRGLPGTPGADGKPGQVSSPKKVAFMVKRTTPLTGSSSQNIDIKFDKIITNIGNGFDPHTSHFTAPVNGTYHFAMSYLAANTAGHIFWHVNGIQVMEMFALTNGGTGSGTVILHLTKGDQVWLKLRKSETMQPTFNSFNGYLMFED